MNEILAFLTKKYQPVAVIVYGSYGDGTNDVSSDFDALLVTADGEKRHDVSVVSGVQLDVFVYPKAEIEGEFDSATFAQIFDGKVILDTDGIGQRLLHTVSEDLTRMTSKSVEEVLCEIDWCSKMLSRTQRFDAEGYFRWHWLLTDSLEILCDIYQYPYRGPKKSLRWLQETHPNLYCDYRKALEHMEPEYLCHWIDELRQAFTQRHPG